MPFGTSITWKVISAKRTRVFTQFVLENMNGSKEQSGGKDHSSTFVATASNFFGWFNNFQYSQGYTLKTKYKNLVIFTIFFSHFWKVLVMEIPSKITSSSSFISYFAFWRFFSVKEKIVLLLTTWRGMQMDDISAAYFAELGCAGSILPYPY